MSMTDIFTSFPSGCAFLNLFSINKTVVRFPSQLQGTEKAVAPTEDIQAAPSHNLSPYRQMLQKGAVLLQDPPGDQRLMTSSATCSSPRSRGNCRLQTQALKEPKQGDDT